jgi:hypothetical protein
MARLALIALALALPTLAAAQVTPACRADLNTVDDSFAETLGRLDRAARAGDAEKCAAVDHHIQVMTSGRDVYLRCLPSDHDRNENVAQLNASIDDFLVIRRNLKCPVPAPPSTPDAVR